MNNSKAKRRAHQLIEQAKGTLREAMRELETIPKDDVDMRLDDAHAFLRRAVSAADGASVSISSTL